jgi:hypothetical protein
MAAVEWEPTPRQPPVGRGAVQLRAVGRTNSPLIATLQLCPSWSANFVRMSNDGGEGLVVRVVTDAPMPATTALPW